MYEVLTKFKFKERPPTELDELFLADGCILTFLRAEVESGIAILERWKSDIVCFGNNPLDDVSKIEKSSTSPPGFKLIRPHLLSIMWQ